LIETQQLRQMGRTPPLPLTVKLDNDSELIVSHWLRILPGKRFVGQAEVDGCAVLAKLFVAPGADRHFDREIRGIQLLIAAQIGTPAIVGRGRVPGGGYYLLTEFMGDAQSLSEEWNRLEHNSPDSAAAVSLLTKALACIGAMHAKGLAQQDLHLGNFLLHDDVLYVVDGDAVENQGAGGPLSADQAEANLGIFFAQLGTRWDDARDCLLVSYLQTNPHQAISPENIALRVAKVRRKRLSDYLGKSLRDCSQFSVEQNWSRFLTVLRSEAVSLTSIINDPDGVFQPGKLLKDGGSSTVALVENDYRSLVVKRYNIKDVGHWLTRFWRPSRAWHSWLAAHRLQFLEIPTPKPLAMMERRFGPLRHTAWLVTEYCPGPTLLNHLGEGTKPPDSTTATALLRVFNQLVSARISHGDCKATNFIWRDGEIVLIDLDAMQVHWNERKWRSAWEKDRARFIRNWPDGSPLAKWLDDNLPLQS